MKSQSKSSVDFDNILCEFEGFNLRPFLLPHIGNKIVSDGVLFIMESHYINPDVFKYQYDKHNLKIDAPELFYNIKANGLTSNFKECLNTRQIITNSESDDMTLAKGKSVYRKLSSVVREGLNLKEDNTNSPLDYVGIYNYFQRPSYKAASTIKVCDKDSSVAYEALKHILKTVKFQKIIFTSAKSYDCFIKMDNINNKEIQLNKKVYRGAHPRVWGNACSYDKRITWKKWVINRL